jgi:hypothetical protein
MITASRNDTNVVNNLDFLSIANFPGKQIYRKQIAGNKFILEQSGRPVICS